MTRQAGWLLIVIMTVVGFAPVGIHSQTPPPPILVITNSTSPNPFGAYLGEVLRAEGLTQFQVKDVSAVKPTDLANAQLVLLAETPLTGTQASLLSNFVAGGGRLVAMRPDSQLAPVLGLTPAGSSTTEGYFRINEEVAFADGFPITTLPFHGQANNYAPVDGSVVLATLFSDAHTATAFPAVIRWGRTVTWTYDLARSVVYTRQGNPDNASDRDGQPPYRTEDLFYNAIDRDKVNIPYADVQMRMLSRVIGDLLADATPVPRLWYFPGSSRTLVVITSDSHANPQSYFDEMSSIVEARGVRDSFYVYNGDVPNPAEADAWRANGYGVGMHPSAYQYGRTIDDAFRAAESYFANSSIGTPSRTTRIHQLEWQGWVDAAKVEAAHGIGLDTSFSTWGPAVTYADGHQAHGFINGSGLPMRFIDQSGAIVPVYQQVTSVVDEQLIVSAYSELLTPAEALVVTRQMIDDSQAGGYSALTTLFHIDYANQTRPWLEGILDYAKSNGIPMWTAERWLNYNSARAATTLTGFSWAPASKQLSFTVCVPADSEPQSVTLPGTFGSSGVDGVLLDGVPVAVVAQAISGRSTIFLSVPPGAHTVVASYTTPTAPPEHAPLARADAASVMEGHTVVIPVLANDADADDDPLTVVSMSPDPGATLVVNANQTISYTPHAGTCGSDSFTYTVGDGRGGTATADVTVTVGCLNSQVAQTTAADFGSSCSVLTNTTVSRLGDGEVRLAGSQGDDYNQPALDPAKWVAGTWSGGAYTPSILNGILSLASADGAFVRSVSSVPMTTLEAAVRFSSRPTEHVGWGSLNLTDGYALFSTGTTTTNVFARTRADGNSAEQQTDLGSIPSGFHIYRIERQVISPTATIISYYVDAMLRAQHTISAIAPMYVYQSHNGGAGRTLDIDRIWVFPPYAAAGTFQSCTIDIGHALSSWSTAEWSATIPAGTTFRLRTRTSTDGSTWTNWSVPMTSSGQRITSPAGRYLQYLAEFSTGDSNQSAVLDAVTLRFGDSRNVRPPLATSVKPADFDGDLKAESAVYRPSTGYWYILQSSNGYKTYLAHQWGESTDIPVAGDYDGDGKTDIAVYRPSTGVWYILQSSTNYTTYLTRQWGMSTDTPVPGDYDGDGKTDIAVYRPSTGTWYILESSTNYSTYVARQWGMSTDIPVPGDYDGDAKTDIAVYRPSTGSWYILESSTNNTTYAEHSLGLVTDVPVAGDYDGDGKTDVAVYRPSTGYWYILESSTHDTTPVERQWGLSTDIPVAGDYDGDGKTDIAVYRPSTGYWYILKSSTNDTSFIEQQWGVETDTPINKF